MANANLIKTLFRPVPMPARPMTLYRVYLYLWRMADAGAADQGAYMHALRLVIAVQFDQRTVVAAYTARPKLPSLFDFVDPGVKLPVQPPMGGLTAATKDQMVKLAKLLAKRIDNRKDRPRYIVETATSPERWIVFDTHTATTSGLVYFDHEVAQKMADLQNKYRKPSQEKLGP